MIVYNTFRRERIMDLGISQKLPTNTRLCFYLTIEICDENLKDHTVLPIIPHAEC